jgi:hypothetical protein
MTRRLFTLASLISLALCLAAAALWVRSHARFCWFDVGFGDAMIRIRAERGEVAFSPGRPGMVYYLLPYPNSRVWSPSLDDLCEHHLAGFGLTWKADAFGNGRVIVVPDWFLLAISAVLPAAWLVAFLKACSRIAAGCCRSCGYILTGNTSGVCPECGTAVPAEAKA